MHMNVLLIYMSICHVCPGNGDVDGCEPPCGCLESNHPVGAVRTRAPHS